MYTIGKGHSASDEIAHKHPAIFPEKLAQDHILSWSNAGDLVYDPFLGSGTVALMAELNGRNYLGSEINENYCELAKERLRRSHLSKEPKTKETQILAPRETQTYEQMELLET